MTVPSADPPEAFPEAYSDLEAGRDEIGNQFLEDPDLPESPPWFDERKFERGRRFFVDFLVSVLFAYLFALIVGFSVPSLAAAVSFTGESRGPAKSRKRYLATIGHIASWHETDIFEPGAKGFASIRKVREWHDRVRRQMGPGPGRPPVSQYDTALVQSGFVGPIVLYPRELGIACEEEDLECYVYFWRVIGFVLGLKDAFNVCGGGLGVARRLCRQVEQEVIVPGLRERAPLYQSLVDDFVDGMRELNPLLTRDGLYAYVFPRMGLPMPAMNLRDWILWLILQLEFYLVRHLPPFRRWCNRRARFMLEQLCPPLV